MENDHYLIELLVYASTKENFWKRFVENRERHIDELYAKAGQPEVGKDRAWFQERYFVDSNGEVIRRFGGPWRYNQVVGVLGIYALGSQLRGDLWLTTFKAVRRVAAGHRRIEWHCHEVLIDVCPEDRTEEIFARLLEAVRELQAEPPLKGRFIDARPLELIGRFVDWRCLCDLSTERATDGLRLDNLEPLPRPRPSRTQRKNPSRPH